MTAGFRAVPDSGREGQTRFEALYDVLTRLAARPTLAATLEEVLTASIELVGADAGYIRLFDAGNVDPQKSTYPFVVHQGISDRYIEYFSSLSQPVDAKSRDTVFHGRRVIIDDMTTHPAFAAHRDIILAEGYRSLHATPLMSRSGARCVGVIHTCFRDVYTPPAAVFETLDVYAELAATAIDRERQLADLLRRDSTLGAVLDKQAVRLEQLQERLRMLEDRAPALAPEDIRQAARAISDELRHATAEMSGAALPRLEPQHGAEDPAPHAYGLSTRELEVMRHVWRGLPDKQIAMTLGISRFTVAKHIGSCLRKMNVDTRTEASVLFERESLYRMSPET